MDDKLGTWKRYKVKNEEQLYKFMGQPEAYAMVKDLKVTVTIEKIEDGYREIYERGPTQVISTITTNSISIKMGENGTIKLDESERLDNGIKFTHNGIKRKQQKEFKGKDEFILHDDYDDGKIVVLHYFKKLS